MSRTSFARWLTIGVATPALMACNTLDMYPTDGAEAGAPRLVRHSSAEAAEREPALRPAQIAARRPSGDAPAPGHAGGATEVAVPGGAAPGYPRASRDLEIAELRRRIEELERGSSPEVITRPASSPRGQDPWASSMVVAQAEGAPASESEAGRDAPEAAAPGQLDVSADDAERALERTLVATGALLLPFGKLEVEPAFAYTRREVTVPTFVTQGGSTFVGESKLRRNEFVAGLGLRVGLPWDSQLELDLPYRLVDQSQVTTIGGVEQGENDDTGSGVGDLTVGFAKTLVREQGWVPDVVARVSYDSNTGKTKDSGVVLGGGFHEVGGSVSFTKRQDPLAFVGSIGYEHTFEDDNVQPGDQIFFTIGTVLAASPETSLRLVLTQQFIDDVEIDGSTVDGSDQVIGTLSIGAAAILGRGILLDGALGVGLTDDGPDYSVRVSLPIRFDLPIPGT